MKRYWGIKPTNRATTPDARRQTGWENDQGINAQYLNDAVYGSQVDHIFGTAAQVAVHSANVKVVAGALQDSTGAAVTLSQGDRIAILGWDGGDYDFAEDDLEFEMNPDTSIDLDTGADTITISGDGCRGRLNLTLGTDGALVWSGVQGFLDIVADSPHLISNSGVNEYSINGNLVERFAYGGVKNGIINGAGLFWQRGTSFSPIVTENYFADRFVWRHNGVQTVDISRSTDTHDTEAFPYSMLFEANGVETLNAGDFYMFGQRIEGFTANKFRSKKAPASIARSPSCSSLNVW